MALSHAALVTRLVPTAAPKPYCLTFARRAFSASVVPPQASTSAPRPAGSTLGQDLPPPASLPPHRSLNPRHSTAPSSLSLDPADAIDLLKSQPNHYVVAFLLGRKFLVQKNDLITLPRAHDLRVGDVVELTRVTEVGSRNFTLKATRNGTIGHAKRETAPPAAGREGVVRAARPEEATVLKPAIPHYLDEGLVKATAIVVEHTRGEFHTVIKKKRRKGYKKTIHGKPAFTRLRLSDITFPTAVPSQTA